MKDHQKENVLLIYYKRKDGKPLTGEEELAWAQYRIQYSLPDEGQYDENKLHAFARLQQRVLPWEQFKQKDTHPLTIAYPTEKQEATVQLPNPSHRKRYLAVAASLLLLLGVGYWLWSGKKTVDTTTTTVVESPAILPGSIKATLHLVDGRTILLNTTTHGQLALQGTVGVYASEPGQVTYSPGVEKSDPQPVQNKMVVPRGGEHQLVLADGTKVWLNAASSFSYPVAFGDSARVVNLDSGEAYFEVSKRGAHQPFIVLSKGKQIKVLGTHFNVNAYDDTLAATLLEGSVQVTVGKQQKLLRPGQQALADAKGIRVQTPKDIQDVIAWKNKYFSYHNTRLSIIMGQVERWYDVKVIYKEPLNDEQFVIDDFPRSSPLQELLDNLEVSRLVHFKVEGRQIIVTK